MKSSQPKVLHELAGRPLIEHVLRTVDALHAASTVVVVGHGADRVRAALALRPSLELVVQSPQLGTGHALLQAESALTGKSGIVLLLYADVPLLQASTLTRLVEHHRTHKAAATVLTMELPEPYGYGRIVRDKKGLITRIVEERDASGEHRKIHEVNSGIYCFNLQPLFGALHQLETDNAQGEYYLTDLIAMYRQRKLRVETLTIDTPGELRGVNSRLDLAELGGELRARKNRDVMMATWFLPLMPSSSRKSRPSVIGWPSFERYVWYAAIPPESGSSPRRCASIRAPRRPPSSTSSTMRWPRR